MADGEFVRCCLKARDSVGTRRSDGPPDGRFARGNSPRLAGRIGARYTISPWRDRRRRSSVRIAARFVPHSGACRKRACRRSFPNNGLTPVRDRHPRALSGLAAAIPRQPLAFFANPSFTRCTVRGGATWLAAKAEAMRGGSDLAPLRRRRQESGLGVQRNVAGGTANSAFQITSPRVDDHWPVRISAMSKLGKKLVATHRSSTRTPLEANQKSKL